MNFICHNGKFLPADSLLFTAGNRGFRYGDGVFETAKVFEGKLLLSALHFNRLFTSLQLLGIKPGPQFTPQILEENILQLCQKNSCAALARVRALPETERGRVLSLVAALKPGASPPFKLQRRDETVEVTVVPGKRPKPRAQLQMQPQR